MKIPLLAETGAYYLAILLIIVPSMLIEEIKEKINKKPRFKEKLCGCIIGKNGYKRYCDYHRMKIGEIK